MPTPDSPVRPTLAQAARALLACGLRPVPMIAAEKRPALKRWRERASLDREAVVAAFAEARADAIGVATGEGVFVMDLDRNHANGADGVAAFADLARGREPLPEGPRVRTPNGGLHLYFAAPPGLRVSSAAPLRIAGVNVPGFDVRGGGGLAMVPPSALPDGRAWRWIAAPWDVAPPLAPDWLLRLVCPARPAARPSAPARPFSGQCSAYARAAQESELAALSSTPPGARNAALFKAAASLGSLCAAGALPADAVAASLVEAAGACGLVADDGRHAVEATIASGLKAGLARPRALPSRHGRRA